MGSRLTILGAGESGVGAALLAQHQGLEVWVSDSGMITPKYQKLLDRNNIEYEQGTHSMDKILNTDEIVKSPGIPDQLELIQTILDEGIPIISELEFASRYTEAKLITITGTNGKSTTTLLTHHLLKESGIDVGLAGNIGVSLAKRVMEGTSSHYVLRHGNSSGVGKLIAKPHHKATEGVLAIEMAKRGVRTRLPQGCRQPFFTQSPLTRIVVGNEGNPEVIQFQFR